MDSSVNVFLTTFTEKKNIFMPLCECLETISFNIIKFASIYNKFKKPCFEQMTWSYVNKLVSLFITITSIGYFLYLFFS